MQCSLLLEFRTTSRIPVTFSLFLISPKKKLLSKEISTSGLEREEGRILGFSRAGRQEELRGARKLKRDHHARCFKSAERAGGNRTGQKSFRCQHTNLWRWSQSHVRHDKRSSRDSLWGRHLYCWYPFALWDLLHPPHTLSSVLFLPTLLSVFGSLIASVMPFSSSAEVLSDLRVDKKT